MAEHPDLACPICLMGFTTADRLPIDLGCGHCFCGPCIERSVTSFRRCPECRTPAQNPHVAYVLLRLLSSLPLIMSPSASSSTITSLLRAGSHTPSLSPRQPQQPQQAQEAGQANQMQQERQAAAISDGSELMPRLALDAAVAGLLSSRSSASSRAAGTEMTGVDMGRLRGTSSWMTAGTAGDDRQARSRRSSSTLARSVSSSGLLFAPLRGAAQDGSFVRGSDAPMLLSVGTTRSDAALRFVDIHSFGPLEAGAISLSPARELGSNGFRDSAAGSQTRITSDRMACRDLSGSGMLTEDSQTSARGPDGISPAAPSSGLSGHGILARSLGSLSDADRSQTSNESAQGDGSSEPPFAPTGTPVEGILARSLRQSSGNHSERPALRTQPSTDDNASTPSADPPEGILARSLRHSHARSSLHASSQPDLPAPLDTPAVRNVPREGILARSLRLSPANSVGPSSLAPAGAGAASPAHPPAQLAIPTASGSSSGGTQTSGRALAGLTALQALVQSEGHAPSGRGLHARRGWLPNLPFLTQPHSQATSRGRANRAVNTAPAASSQAPNIGLHTAGAARGAETAGEARATLVGRAVLSELPQAVHEVRNSFWSWAGPVMGVLYLISPLDLIPDFIPLLGWLDDMVVLGTVIYMIYHLATAVPQLVVLPDYSGADNAG